MKIRITLKYIIPVGYATNGRNKMKYYRHLRDKGTCTFLVGMLINAAILKNNIDVSQ